MSDNESKDSEALELVADRGHGHEQVNITVNGVTVGIHRGRQTVAEIKRAGAVPDADVLALQVDGKLTELPDDGHVVIKGGEHFVSYPRACASS